MANAKSYARRNVRRLPAGLLVLLACAAVLRIGLTLVTEGYSTDVACFTAWAQRLADLGPGQFYSPDYFADYPPGYMLVLWVLGSLGKLLGMNVSGKGFVLLLSSVPIPLPGGCVLAAESKKISAFCIALRPGAGVEAPGPVVRASAGRLLCAAPVHRPGG